MNSHPPLVTKEDLLAADRRLALLPGNGWGGLILTPFNFVGKLGTRPELIVVVVCAPANHGWCEFIAN